MTVYIDILFLINLIINYLLLLATAKITKQPTSILRIIIGAISGAVYSVCMFLPQISVLYTVSSKIAISFIIVALTFTIRKLKTFLKTVCVFYITSFIFGGISLGLFYFTGAGKGTVISNGIFYYNLPLRLLIISTAFAYAIIHIIWKSYKSDRPRDFKEIEIYFSGKKVLLNALVDTGNMLTEPITHTPVIVAEYKRIKNIFPNSFNLVYEKMFSFPEDIILNEEIGEMSSKLRVIPFISLGSSNGMMLGFKPDAVKIDNKLTNNIIIGISESNLSKSKDYDALLNPEIISGGI